MGAGRTLVTHTGDRCRWLATTVVLAETRSVRAFCGQCGGATRGTARFCESCGADLVRAEETADMVVPTGLSRVPRGAVFAAVGIVFVAAASALALVAGHSDPEPAATAVAVAPPVLEPPIPTGPAFRVGEVPRTAAMFPERVADLVDLERQTERVEAERFRLASYAIVPQFGEDQRITPRSSWAVPLGVVDRGAGRELAVATTRCLVDYRYPTNAAHDNYRNLAIFSDDGRVPEVYRLRSGAALPGLVPFDQRREAWFFTSRLYLEGDPGVRYFGDLEDPGLQAEVTLPIGSWESNDGADIVVIYFPLRDRGTRSLEPRRHLGVDEPERELRNILEPRLSLFGDTFTFSLVSSECMAVMAADAVGGSSSDSMIVALVTVVAVGVLGTIVSPGLAAILPSAIVGRMGEAALETALGAVANAVWRTITRVLANEPLEDVVWDEAGHVVMSFMHGEVLQRVVLAGVSGLDLDESARGLVLETVRHVAASEGSTLAVLTNGGDDADLCLEPSTGCVGAIVNTESELDVAAELIRLGLVALDLSDPALVAQSPGLLAAARDAITDPLTRSAAAISDASYQARIVELAAAL